MTTLSVHSDILRVYADAVRKVFASTLAEGGSQAEAVQLVLSLADATVQCAENIIRKEAQIAERGVANVPPKLRLIEGGQR
jgi:hypothetical protein